MATATVPSNDRPGARGRCGCGKHHADLPNSDALQRILEAPGSIVRQWNQPGAIRGLEIVAGPGQPLSSDPKSGDILIRTIDGGGGHVALVASPGLWSAEDLSVNGLTADAEGAEGYVHVTERAPIVRDPSERFARGITDQTGRLLEDLLLLRLATQPPTVIKVEQPAAATPSGSQAGIGNDKYKDVPAVSLSSTDTTDTGNLLSGPTIDVPFSEDTGIIGSDDRVRITPTTDVPWRWMCHVEATDSSSRVEGHGSGVLISNRHVLTAAHVIWGSAQNPQLHFIQVRPGLDYDREPFDSWSASRIRVCPKYDPSAKDSDEWDYGLITLDKSIGDQKFKAIQNQLLRFWGTAEFGGNFTMGPGEPKVLISSDAFTTGYRGSKAYGKELWCAKGNIRSIGQKARANSLFITADATEGQSGAPLWMKNGDVRTMVGIVVAAGRDLNTARRITPGMIAELRRWIAADNENPWMEATESTESQTKSAVSELEASELPTMQEDEVACGHIDAARLSWSGATTQQLDLMRRVYLRQVAAACQVRAFVPDVSDAELEEIEQGVRARRPAAGSCRALLAAARNALFADVSAVEVKDIGVISGYRSASHQLSNWSRNFPRYYAETQADRAAADGGELGSAAAALLTRYIGRRLAAPGFSLHNDGRAVDFFTVQAGKSMGADTSARNRSNWRASWFFQWLISNGGTYGFFQNTSIDEPWHWEFRQVETAPATQSVELYGFAKPPETVEPTDTKEIEAVIAPELTIANGRLELRNTALLATHRGTQPDLILRWNDMTDPAAIDVVVHFHGYSSDRARMSLLRKESYSGLDFSNPNDPSESRSGRTLPTLAILPRGSYTGDQPKANPERYTFPALITSSGVRDVIAYGLSQFQSSTGAPSDLAPRRLIFTAHSGGGAALMRVLQNNTPDEIQIFDALYGDASALISWVNLRMAAEIQAWTSGKTRADGGLCVLYRSGGTEGESRRVRRAIETAIATAPVDAQSVLAAAYRVRRTSVSHGEIPRRFGWLLLADIAQPFADNQVFTERESAELVPGEQSTGSPVGRAKTSTATSTAGATARLPLEVSLSAQLRLYEASDQWIPSGPPKNISFNPTRLSSGEWSIPPIQVPIAAGRRWIFEIWISIGSASQAFFWRCDATGVSGIRRLEPLGSQPGTVPGSPVVPSPTGDNPVLGTLTGTQTFTGTQAMLQVSGQVTGASSSLQGQLGANLPVVPQVAGQRTAPAPQYSVTFTADVIVQGGPAPLNITDHFVQFANDSSTITPTEVSKLLQWVHETVGQQPHLREAIRAGQVPVLITGKASLRGHEHHADHNLVLSQRRVEAVRLVLQGAASAAAGGRTQGGALGSENVKIDAEADGDFHDPAPANIDQDRLVQISIDGSAASAAVQRLSDASANP